MESLTHGHGITKAKYLQSLIGDWMVDQDAAFKEEQTRLCELYVNRIWDALGADETTVVNLVSMGCDSDIACSESWCLMPQVMLALERKSASNNVLFNDNELPNQEMEIAFFEVPQPEYFRLEDDGTLTPIPATQLKVVTASAHWQFWPGSSSSADWFWVGPYAPVSPWNLKMDDVKELL